MKCICPNCKTEFDPEEIQLTEKRRAELVAIIQRICERHFKVSHFQMAGNSKEPKYANPRHVAMYLLTEYTDLTLKRIGVLYGGRDHSTVINARKRCKNALDTKMDLYDDIMLLKQSVASIAYSIKPAA